MEAPMEILEGNHAPVELSEDSQEDYLVTNIMCLEEVSVDSDHERYSSYLPEGY